MRLLYEPLTDIPVGFTKVEYLESTGTQYIDTGYVPTSTTLKYETHIYTPNMPTGEQDIVGYYIQGSGANVLGLYQKYVFNYTKEPPNAADLNIVSATFSGANDFYISAEANGDNLTKSLTVNGVTSTGTLRAEQTAFSNILLFKVNSNVGSYVGKIYYCKIYHNNSLVRDFVPCLDNNNVPCMYDKVEGKAYYNQGTGTFTYGRKIIPVEYLESSGTQYIDTGIKGKSGISAKTKVNYTYLSGSASHAIGGEYTTNTSCYFGMVRANGHFTYLYKNSVIETTTTISTNTDYDIDVTLNNGNQRFVINGNVVSTGTVSGDFTATNNLFLYAINSVNGADVYGSLKMYYMQISDNGTLVRDFIPCKDENNVGFMFDKVTHSAYLNAGTGSFTFGKTLPKKKLRLIKDSKRRLPKGFKEVEYLESSGTQYIDTGYKPTNTTGHYMVMSYTTANNTVAFGTMVSGNGVVGPYYAPSSSTVGWWTRWGSSEPRATATVTANTKYKVYLNYNNDRISKVNDVIIDNNLASFTAGAYGNLTLFRRNYSSGYGYFTGKIYCYQMTEGNTLIRDMIPCLDRNNTPCMYDLVEGKAYYNAGTGSFTYGHTITPVKYLESSGTQYIDTGYTSNNIYENSACEVICETTDLSNRVLGCGGLSDNNKNISLSFSVGGYIVGLYGDRWTSNIFSYSTNTKYKIKFEVSTSQQKLYVDDSLIDTTTYSWNSSNNYPLRLFKTNADTYTKPTKIYSFKLWISGSLVKDLIPVKDENNVGYLLDLVTHTLYANAGSGSFVVGSEYKDITRFLEGE